MKKKDKKKENIVNYGKIKRNIIIRDTNLDSRFTSKVIKDKKKENNKKICKNKNFDNE
jgi:hypothetical protein